MTTIPNDDEEKPYPYAIQMSFGIQALQEIRPDLSEEQLGTALLAIVHIVDQILREASERTLDAIYPRDKKYTH